MVDKKKILGEKGMKKKIGLLVLVVLLVSMFAISAQGAKEKPETLRLGISLMTYEHEFMQDMLAAVKKYAAENNIELFDVDGRNDVSVQLSGIEDMLNSKNIDGLLLNPVDTDAIAPAVLDANDAKVPVVTMDVGSSRGDVYAHVASNNIEIGKLAGNYTVELLKARNGEVKGKVVIFGFSKITSMRDRVAGFKEVLASYPQVELIEREPIKLSVDDTLRLAEDTFTTYSNGEIDIYYGSNATTLAGLVAAQGNSGRVDFQLVGVDDDPAFVKALQSADSTLEAFVAQTPTDIGETAVNLIMDAINGKPATEKVVATTITLVTRDSVTDYMKVVEERSALLKAYR